MDLPTPSKMACNRQPPGMTCIEQKGIQPRVPLERTCRNYPEDFPQRDILQSTYHRREIEPEITYSDSFRLIRSGNTTRLPSGFTPLRHQRISAQESLYFPIPGRIQERNRIIGQEQDFFQPEAKRVISYDPELVGPAKRSIKKQQTVLNTYNEASSPRIMNDISTQIKENAVIPESTVSSKTLWLQFSQFVEQPRKEFERLHENISRLQEVNTLKTKAIHTIQEDYTKLSKTSEETKRRLNKVLEEQNHCKRDRNVLDNTYHQEDIKADAFLENKPRSPSKYQDGYKMTYSEKEALKQLSEASSWPNFSGVGEYDHMELIDYIDGLFIEVPNIPDYWITARLNTAFKGHSSIWYTEMKEIHGRRNWPWWRSQYSKKYINDTWIWQKALPFGNDRYTVDKDPYNWCLRQSKRLIAIDPHITTEMRNHKLLTKLPGDLEHAVKCRCSKEFTMYEILTNLQELRIIKTIGR
ncbi:hypothetical protein O181_096347 [Austropuccinia psidii MF-1]|uniref:Uncharacterized protein n=1 Tax=Austropuccinia psidii MF-1 TaxID=1389203 RepID=A0A9Q3J6H4_9BASI|nr:hypothetical protein [Austropuccinia psidii MF-1]